MLLRFSEGLQFVDVLLLVNGVIREDQRLTDCSEGVLDAIEIHTTLLISTGSSDHRRSELVSQLFDCSSNLAGLVQRVDRAHGKKRLQI